MLALFISRRMFLYALNSWQLTSLVAYRFRRCLYKYDGIDEYRCHCRWTRVGSLCRLLRIYDRRCGILRYRRLLLVRYGFFFISCERRTNSILCYYPLIDLLLSFWMITNRHLRKYALGQDFSWNKIDEVRQLISQFISFSRSNFKFHPRVFLLFYHTWS